jgi:hypothetical protein
MGVSLYSYLIMLTLADFSCCLWKAESATLSCLPLVPRGSPVAFGNLKKQHIQPMVNKECE